MIRERCVLVGGPQDGLEYEFETVPHAIKVPCPTPRPFDLAAGAEFPTSALEVVRYELALGSLDSPRRDSWGRLRYVVAR